MTNRVRALWVAAALCLVPVGGRAMGTAPEPRPPADRSPLELIAEAREAGTLDPDTAVLYEVYAVKDRDRLPLQFRGERPIRDGTPVLRSARDRYDQLRPEIREALRPYLFPKGRP